jgi:hypothetical protein
MNMDATASKTREWRFDRVRTGTKPEINQRIDEETAHYLRLYARAERQLIGQRLEQLDREWDMERRLEINAATIGLSGLVLGRIINRVWYVLPVMALGFLFQQAMQGFSPPVKLFRWRGVRTRKEIERERYALKLLRGDFDAFHSGEKPDIQRVLQMLDS